MKKINFLITIFLSLSLLNACSTIAEGLGGTKKKGSDEFLVKKKAPLVLPPSFGELPEPGIKKKKKTPLIKEDTANIVDIINQTNTIDSNKENNDLNSSIEKLIIEKINNQ